VAKTFVHPIMLMDAVMYSTQLLNAVFNISENLIHSTKCFVSIHFIRSLGSGIVKRKKKCIFVVICNQYETLIFKEPRSDVGYLFNPASSHQIY